MKRQPRNALVDKLVNERYALPQSLNPRAGLFAPNTFFCVSDQTYLSNRDQTIFAFFPETFIAVPSPGRNEALPMFIPVSLQFFTICTFIRIVLFRHVRYVSCGSCVDLCLSLSRRHTLSMCALV